MRSVCISDTHLTVANINSQSLFPRQVATLPKEKADALYEHARKAIESAKDAAFAWMRENGPWDWVVHLGDVTGGWKEQGCAHPLPRSLASELHSGLKEICPRVRYCIGNHDTGYSHAGSLPGGGINEASISVCEETFGQLWWKEEVDGVTHLGVASPILEYTGDDTAILRRQLEQQIFVGDTLSGIGNPWVFYLHRATACKLLAVEIGDHVGKMRNMICGDFHDPRVMPIIRCCAGMPLLPNIVDRETSAMFHCLRKCVLCPSVAPLWWQGHGLLRFSGAADKLNIDEVALPVDRQFSDLPFASKMRCAWWMVRPWSP